MDEDLISENDVLKQREKQKHLFGEKSEIYEGFKDINHRREESIIEKFEENTKDPECDSKLVDQNNMTFFSKDQSYIQKSLKHTERDISAREPINQKKQRTRVENVKLDVPNGSFRNNSKDCNKSFYINFYMHVNIQKIDDGSPTKVRKTQQVIVSQTQQDPRLQVVMRIKKSMSKFFLNYTYNGRTSNLQNVSCRKMINDLSDYQEIYSRFSTSQLKTQIILYIQRLFTKHKLTMFKVLTLQNQYVLLFKMFTTVMTFIFLIFQSIVIMFNLRYSWQYSESLISNYFFIQWIIEIVLRLNCATYQNNKYIEERSEIISIYFKNYFIYDIIPIVAIQLDFSDSFSWQYLLVKSLIFLKAYITDQDLNEIQKQLVIIIRKYYIVQIINLILKLFIVGHFIACLWQLIGIIDSNFLQDQNSWMITTYDFNGGIWWKVYVQAFSWAFTLMATGSNTATSVLELYFLSIIMPFTTIVFGYMINTIGIILSEIDMQEEFRRKDINIINSYMERKQISQQNNIFQNSQLTNQSIKLQRELQARVNLDLEYFYQKNFKKMQEEEEGVLSKVSDQLYRSLQYEYNMGIFKKMKNLYDNFSYQTLTDLCYKAQEITFSPNQTIFVENQISDSCLMYIISGQGIQYLLILIKFNILRKYQYFRMAQQLFQ